MTSNPATTAPVSPSTPLDPSTIEHRLAFASDLVRRAGKAARVAWQSGNLAVEVKGPQDFVTAIDRDTETLIRTELTQAFPGDHVLGEEFGGAETDGPLWVVDPIDGTANFIRGLTDWAVSLALVHRGDIILGIVYDGGRDLLYWGRAGHGAFCEGRKLQAATTDKLSQALVMMGTNQQTALDDHLDDHRALRALGAEYRRHGSAATGLLMVADGRVDAYYERYLNAWDALGGLCLAREVGAATIFPPMEAFLRTGGPVLCSAPGVFDALPKSLKH